MKKEYLFYLLLFLVGCTEAIDIHTDNSEPVIVIYGTITDEIKQQEVRITRSSPYFDDKSNPSISGAKVTITSSENKVYKLEEDESNPGYYRSLISWAAKVGVEYTLDVEVDFDDDGVMDNYQAATQILPTVTLDSIKIVPMTIMGHANYALNIYGEEPPTEDFYLFKFNINDSLYTKKISQFIVSDDVMFSGQYINGITINYFNDISEWEDDSDEQRKNSIYIKTGDKVEAQMSSVPKGYYDFIIQCWSEMNGENPMFGGPASNITTNISNGGVGFFTGYCITRTSTEVKGYD